MIFLIGDLKRIGCNIFLYSAHLLLTFKILPISFKFCFVFRVNILLIRKPISDLYINYVNVIIV